MQGLRKEVMEIRIYQQRQTLFCNDPNKSFAVKESRRYELIWLMTTDLSAINARVSGGVMRLGGGWGGGVRGVGHPWPWRQHEAGQRRLPGAGRVGGEARPHHVWGAWARGLARGTLTVEAGYRESETMSILAWWTWLYRHRKHLLNCIDTDLIIQLLAQVEWEW